MSDRMVKQLVHYKRATYDGSFNSDLIEQYKVYVQSAENVSARRVASIRYLTTINAALIASYGIQYVSLGLTFWTFLVAIVGTVIALFMWDIIHSHRVLNEVKFQVISEFEKHLPAAPYDREWQLLGEGRSKIYRPISYIESGIPIAFAATHVAAVIGFSIYSTPGWTG